MLFRPPASLAVGALFACATLASASSGALLVVGEPVEGPTSYGFLLTATNDDGGVTYGQVLYNPFRQLSEQLMGLETHDSASIPELVEEKFFIHLVGSSAFGWKVHAQIDGGWLAVPEAPGAALFLTGRGQQMLVSLPLALLELNGVEGHQGFTVAQLVGPDWSQTTADAVIVRSDDPRLEVPNYQGPAAPVVIADAMMGKGPEPAELYPAAGFHYVLLDPRDFAEPTTFAETHPGLDPEEDANGNGRSNFVDYALGDDPLGAGRVRPVEPMAAGGLVLRHRVNAADVRPVLEQSGDLQSWQPMVESVDYTVVERGFEDGRQRLRVQLVAPPPGRFYRLRMP